MYSASTSRRGRAKVFIILLVTESPIYVEIEEGYGREAVCAAVLVRGSADWESGGDAEPGEVREPAGH